MVPSLQQLAALSLAESVKVIPEKGTIPRELARHWGEMRLARYSLECAIVYTDFAMVLYLMQHMKWRVSKNDIMMAIRLKKRELVHVLLGIYITYSPGLPPREAIPSVLMDMYTNPIACVHALIDAGDAALIRIVWETPEIREDIPAWGDNQLIMHAVSNGTLECVNFLYDHCDRTALENCACNTAAYRGNADILRKTMQMCDNFNTRILLCGALHSGDQECIEMIWDLYGEGPITDSILKGAACSGIPYYFQEAIRRVRITLPEEVVDNIAINVATSGSMECVNLAMQHFPSSKYGSGTFLENAIISPRASVAYLATLFSLLGNPPIPLMSMYDIIHVIHADVLAYIAQRSEGAILERIRTWGLSFCIMSDTPEILRVIIQHVSMGNLKKYDAVRLGNTPIKTAMDAIVHEHVLGWSAIGN